MRPLLFDLHAADGLAHRLATLLGADLGSLEQRQFPDEESYVRLESEVEDRDVILLCSLDRPEPRILPLLFAAQAARDQGARSVGLAAPYLAYMRQDKAFRPGEAVTSRTFARLLSDALDWLATLDPHLHRYPALDSLYAVPAVAGSAAGPIADWIRDNVEQPVLVGPDEESAHWVERIAGLAGAASTVFRKERRGDFEVKLSAKHAEIPARATPVVVDDIASSARTMIEAVGALRVPGRPAPYCIAVHAIFAGDAYERLLAAAPARIVSTNTVAHFTNLIDISQPLADAISQALAATAR